MKRLEIETREESSRSEEWRRMEFKRASLAIVVEEVFCIPYTSCEFSYFIQVWKDRIKRKGTKLRYYVCMSDFDFAPLVEEKELLSLSPLHLVIPFFPFHSFDEKDVVRSLFDLSERLLSWSVFYGQWRWGETRCESNERLQRFSLISFLHTLSSVLIYTQKRREERRKDERLAWWRWKGGKKGWSDDDDEDFQGLTQRHLLSFLWMI